jgi:hypothetical protein
VRITRQHLLAAACLALDQDRRIDTNCGGDQRQRFPDCRVFSHEFRRGQLTSRRRRGVTQGIDSDRNAPAQRRSTIEPGNGVKTAKRVAHECRLARAQPPEDLVEGLAENPLETRSWNQRQAGHHAGSTGIHSADRTVLVDRHLSRADCAQELGTRMDRNDHLRPHLLREQAVFDVHRRHLHQCQRMALPRCTIGRRVQDSDQVTARCTHRCRSTADLSVAGIEMLCPVHDDRPAGGNHRTEGVGPADFLGPLAAGDYPATGIAIAKLAVGHRRQHGPVGV